MSLSGQQSYIPQKSLEIGDTTTISELRNTGAFPGPKGVVLTGPYSFGDLYDLSTQGGRTVEFGIGQRIGPNGELQDVVLNGGINRIGFPEDVYPVAHTHPTVNEFQTTPSNADLNFMQQRVSNLLNSNPGASIPPHFIIYSPVEAPTAFSPLPYNYFGPVAK